MGRDRSQDMYRLYGEYKQTLKDISAPLKKRQKLNAAMREDSDSPFGKRDYNDNKNDITNWNSMTKGLIDDMKMMEMYLDFNDRHYLHKEYNDMKSMIYNQSSYEGEIPSEGLYAESISDTTDIICDVELQEEIVELLSEVLTERQKQVVEMYFWGDMTQEKIAKELGITKQAVNDNLTNSIEKLRNHTKLLEIVDF